MPRKYCKLTSSFVGKEFGRLKVVSWTRTNDERGKRRTMVVCTCRCSKIVTIRLDSLVSGKTTSCDCYRAEQALKANTTHGLSFGTAGTPEYAVWVAIKNRCYNPKSPYYKFYGGRGIIMCDKWRKDFVAFLKDVGRRPNPKLTLDRVNNSKGYEPGNVRWTTRKVQSRNMRSNVNITFRGRTQCISAWAEEVGVTHATLSYRLKNWSVEKALTKR